MSSNRKFAVSAIFSGLLLLANACPSRAQAIPTLRSDDDFAPAESSPTTSAANVAATESQLRLPTHCPPQQLRRAAVLLLPRQYRP